MSRSCFILIISVFMNAFFFLAGDIVCADSLWQRRAISNYNLFDDNRGKRVGDIVTIIVIEETSIEGAEDASTDNSSSHSGEINNNAFIDGLRSVIREDRNARFTARAANNYTASFDNNFDGKGDYDSSRSINLRLTAVVVDVLDNGNLLLEGKREVVVNKEKYILKLIGTARSIDIALNNTILSSKMSNVQFGLEGDGWLTRSGKRGWFHRLRDIFWPF